MAAQREIQDLDDAKRVLASIDNYAKLMKAMVECSVHPTPEDAIAELIRSQLSQLEGMATRLRELEVPDTREASTGPDLPALVASVETQTSRPASPLPQPPVVRVPDTREASTGPGLPALVASVETQTSRPTSPLPQPPAVRVPDVREASTGPDLPAPVATVKPLLVVRSAEEVRVATDLLWTAVKAGDAAGARAAIGRGGDLKSRREVNGVRDRTPLHEAAREGHSGVVEVLLAAGAELDERDGGGWTPLILAAAAGREAVVRRLLEAGAQAGAADNRGWTALHLAARNGHLGTVRLLVQAGADVNRRSNDGRTPLRRALDWGRRPTADYLRSVGGTQ